MELQNIFIAALIFVLFMTGTGLFYSSMIETYTPTTNSSYDSFYSTLNQTRDDMIIFSGEASNKLNGTGNQDNPQQNMIQAGWSILKTIPNIFDNIKSMLGAVVMIILPGKDTQFISGIIMAIVGIAIIFAIIRIIFYRYVF